MLETSRSPAHRKVEHRERTADAQKDAQKSSVFRPDSTDEDTHPHACADGLVFLTYTVIDEEVGDEVERIGAVPCRRCVDGAGR